MLIAAPERWDEVCFAVPAIRAMVASGLDIGVLCPAEQRDFWESVHGVTVVDFPIKAKARSLGAELKGNWEAGLVWETGLAADAFKAAEIPRRLGPQDRKLRKILTHPLGMVVGPLEHRVRFFLSAAEELGITTSRPEFFAPASLGITPVTDAVLLSPDSDFGVSHEWPVARWLEIGEKIGQSGRRVTVAGVAGGRGLGKQLADLLGQEVEYFDASPLAGALPLLAVHGFVIAADSSLPHLAAHAGSTCLVLFGPNDPAWKRPLGRRHAIVRRHVECAPCLMSRCPLDMRCQNELETERVWDAASRILQ
jgi:ADP-heptose:LPS heptosyltransferase